MNRRDFIHLTSLALGVIGIETTGLRTVCPALVTRKKGRKFYSIFPPSGNILQQSTKKMGRVKRQKLSKNLAKKSAMNGLHKGRFGI